MTAPAPCPPPSLHLTTLPAVPTMVSVPSRTTWAVFEIVTGARDHVAYLHMSEEPAEVALARLAFSETLMGRRWLEALARREGGSS